MTTTLRRLALCAALALSVTACGSINKPYDGGVHDGKLASRGKLDDPRVKHVKCLKAHDIAYTELRGPQPSGVNSYPEIQVGRPGVGPLIKFYASAGLAQGQQILGQAQAAEVIGSALLYPNQGTDKQLHVIENCTAIGVKG